MTNNDLKIGGNLKSVYSMVVSMLIFIDRAIDGRQHRVADAVKSLCTH
jgi:hypothetical protein